MWISLAAFVVIFSLFSFSTWLGLGRGNGEWQAPSQHKVLKIKVNKIKNHGKIPKQVTRQKTIKRTFSGWH